MQSTEDKNTPLLVSAQLNVLKVAVDRLDTFLGSTDVMVVKHLKSAVEEVERKLTERFPEIADYEIPKGPGKLYIYEGLPSSWTNWFTLDEFLETITDTGAVEAEDIMEELEREAKERKGHGETAPGKTLSQKVEQSDNPNEKKTDAKLAKTFDTNRQYVSDAKKIKEDDPEAHEESKSKGSQKFDDPSTGRADTKLAKTFEHIEESTETFREKFEKTAGLIKEHTSYSGPTDITKVVWGKVALLIANQSTRKKYLIALKESKGADRWFIASPIPLTMDGVELRFRPEDRK